ncbi:hypothetical protein HYH02_005497 [Chlamydomonas schloesseri]|uniref:Uncharacterized protein n=1 Tax=Chlamydomonas schloesseri TaxID=2026947 RepID=A0A835WL17_9CHLO|nr:hypothetical protein HYH02_005497 [Chlamydomonas schloesseri]|eukprot:KAG2449342.1 hypothetical protein HYH02_005497 [Chlamydomonas schloesseri]
MRHGTLILSAEGLEEDEERDENEEEQDEDEDEEGQAPGSGRKLLAAARNILLGFEESVKGSEATGPVELVVVRAPAAGPARAAALGDGLAAGLREGCDTVMVIEVKADAKYHNIWQALAAGIELAHSNMRSGTSLPAAPVRVVLTDMRKWYFLGLQALGGTADCEHAPAPSSTAAAAPASASAAAAAATAPGSATAATRGAAAGSAPAGSGTPGAVSGIEFTLESKGTFRLFDCRILDADVLSPEVEAAPALVKAMYCLYSAMYPDEDIRGLPAAVAEGNRQARQAVEVWLQGRTAQLKQLARAADAEARAAAAEARAADAEAKAAAAEKENAELRAQLAKAMAAAL